VYASGVLIECVLLREHIIILREHILVLLLASLMRHGLGLAQGFHQLMNKNLMHQLMI